MQLQQITTLEQQHKEAIFRLWNKEYPGRLRFASLNAVDLYLEKLEDQQHYFLISDEQIVGWGFVFVREQATWFAIIVDSAFQQKGLGRQLLAEMKSRHSCLNGWAIDHNHDKKTDGTAYLSPLPFYIKNGFNVCDEHRLETEQLSAVKITWKL